MGNEGNTQGQGSETQACSWDWMDAYFVVSFSFFLNLSCLCHPGGTTTPGGLTSTVRVFADKLKTISLGIHSLVVGFATKKVAFK